MKNILTLTILLLLFSCNKDSENNSPAQPAPPKPDPFTNKTIVFWRPNPEGGIFTFDEKGENEKKLLALPSNSTVAYPDWSPTNRIFFTGTLQGESNAQLYSMKADGSDVVRITNQPNVAYSHLDVSAKNQLLYVKTFTDGSSNAGLYYSSANGLQEKKLFDINDFTLSDVSWVPYNAWNGVVYISNEIKIGINDKASNIFLINLESTYKANLTENFSERKVYNRLSFQTQDDLFLTTAIPDVNTGGYGVYLVGADNSLGRFEALLLPASSKEESWINSQWITGSYWRDPIDLTGVGTLLLTDNKNNLHLYNFNDKTLKQLTQRPSFDAKVNYF